MTTCPVHPTLDPRSPQYFPFGNTRYQNILRDLSIKQSGVLKVLFLGCGDLRNTLELTRNQGTQNVHIHLNDHSAMVMARNIIILKIISAHDFNPDNQEDISFLWDVWYNNEWPENTRQRFIKVLKDVSNGTLPENVLIPQSGDFQKLKEVFNDWCPTISKTPGESEHLMKQLQKARPKILMEAMKKDYPGVLNRNRSPDDVFSELIDQYINEWEEKRGTLNLHDRIKQTIREEARDFIRKGWCRFGNAKVVCVNPTLLHNKTRKWIMDYSCFPFDGYLPLQFDEELDTSFEDKLLIRFCQENLMDRLSSYRQHMKEIKIYFHLSDAFEFCFKGTSEKFDVIDCSNIADHSGLANLINASSLRLSDSPNAILYTQSMYWYTDTASVKQYVEHQLCCPLNMIPTIFGLKLLDRIELGTFAPDPLLFPTRPVTLCWKKTPPFQNISLSKSPSLHCCLIQLANRCCSIDGPFKGSDGDVHYKWTHFTPNTFQFIADSMSQRIDVDLSLFNLDIPSSFNLARQTIEAWKSGQPILKFSIDQFLTELEIEYFSVFNSNYTEKMSSMVRLVLAPSNGNIKNSLTRNIGKQSSFKELIRHPDVHLIDNFELAVNNSSDNSSRAKISFLLSRDHGLKTPYLGFILDLDSFSPILLFESFNDLKVEEFLPSPYPFVSGKSTRKTGDLVVDRCEESWDNYTLKISVHCPNAEGLEVTSSRMKPCESAHEVTVSLSQPNNIEPLILSFPCPVIIGKDCATLHRNQRSIEMVLKKSIFEPWPYEFQAIKWDPDYLKPWKQEDCDFKSLERHVVSQLKPHTDLSELAALTEIRKIIHDIFMKRKSFDGDLFVSIQQKGTRTKRNCDYHWFLRIHETIFMSPIGSPILILSALDNRQGLAINEDIDRIFFRETTAKNTMQFSATIKQIELLRFVLRLNSTKILPINWQKKNLPLGENNPFLITFISPLYLDLPVQEKRCDITATNLGLSNAGKFKSAGVKIDNKSHCVVCNTKPSDLKRCSKCRSVVYCSANCQRSHWPQHKTVCKMLSAVHLVLTS